MAYISNSLPSPKRYANWTVAMLTPQAHVYEDSACIMQNTDSTPLAIQGQARVQYVYVAWCNCRDSKGRWSSDPTKKCPTSDFFAFMTNSVTKDSFHWMFLVSVERVPWISHTTVFRKQQNIIFVTLDILWTSPGERRSFFLTVCEKKKEFMSLSYTLS